ncbi:MAG TPA: endonuclease/exonuclease/phosphatase family protein [Pyrinomonadaceae bacterium]|jgi:endonuclease/exonuclease/phosphatase family metal-dependent hydrolase
MRHTRPGESVATNLPNTDGSPGIETASFASETNADAPSKLVIASYNIRYGVGSFLITGSLLRHARLTLPRRRHALVNRHLQRAALALSDGGRLPPVDIVALQEADRETVRAGGHHIARELASALRMHYASALLGLPRDEAPQANKWYLDFEEHIAPDDKGDTGIALLSRLPFAKLERVALPWTECAWRPRLALAATIQVGAEQLHLFNSHIDPHADTIAQLEQHKAVLARAEKLGGAVVLLGDFNTLTKRSGQAMRRLLEAHGYHTPFPNGVATWRAGLIRLQTDWIFVRGAEVTRWGVARRLGVSDHWPIWVEVKLETAGSS